MTFKEFSQDPITASLDLADNLVLLTESLSPDIHSLIQASLPAFEQRKFTQRMRRCKRHCRHNHFGVEEIDMQVRIDFRDVPELQDKIIKLLTFELIKK